MSDIRWKKVDYAEYYQHSDSLESPSRVTYYGDNGDQTMYEIGAIPVRLPKKRGAIVAPPKDNGKWLGYNPYVLAGDGEWHEVNEQGALEKERPAAVQSYLDQGWVIAFEGVE